MTGARLAAPPVLVTGSAASAWAERVAALTRAAYRGSDPLPGLPEPDGAFESDAAVRDALAGGELLWLAPDDEGALRGALRVAVRPGSTWHVQRVVVDPLVRGAGVARELLAAVERAASSHGALRIRLHAVVERCLPPLYARLGYEVVDHWPAEDKRLTEVTMERRPGAPAPGRWLPSWRARPSGTVVCWLLSGAELVRVVRASDGDPLAALHDAGARLHRQGSPDVRLAGVDAWTGAGEPPDATPEQRLPGGRASVAQHLAPRSAHDEMWAAWRFRPGTEPRPEDAWPAT
ncbi:MAG: GNAT family N-acetyltransferase [Frankiaceae bacterium]